MDGSRPSPRPRPRPRRSARCAPRWARAWVKHRMMMHLACLLGSLYAGRVVVCPGLCLRFTYRPENALHEKYLRLSLRSRLYDTRLLPSLSHHIHAVHARSCSRQSRANTYLVWLVGRSGSLTQLEAPLCKLDAFSRARAWARGVGGIGQVEKANLVHVALIHEGRR